LCGGRRRRRHGGLRRGSKRRSNRHDDEDENRRKEKRCRGKKISMLLIPCKDVMLSEHSDKRKEEDYY